MANESPKWEEKSGAQAKGVGGRAALCAYNLTLRKANAATVITSINPEDRKSVV